MKKIFSKILTGALVCCAILSSTAANSFAAEATQKITDLDSKYGIHIRWDSSKQKVILTDTNKKVYQYDISEWLDYGAINVKGHLEMTDTNFHQFLDNHTDEISHDCN